MDQEKILDLFRCINKDTVTLVDSLSVLGALSELGAEHAEEAQLYQEILKALGRPAGERHH